MARYRQLMVQDDTGWHLMSPSNAWEALRIAWMLWRHPDRVAVLVGVKNEFMIHLKQPETQMTAAERSDRINAAGRAAMRAIASGSRNV